MSGRCGNYYIPVLPLEYLRCYYENFPWGKSVGNGGGYGPYAILNWCNPIVSIIYGFTGISMEKMTEEEYEKVLKEREAEKKAALEALSA